MLARFSTSLGCMATKSGRPAHVAASATNYRRHCPKDLYSPFVCCERIAAGWFVGQGYRTRARNNREGERSSYDQGAPVRGLHRRPIIGVWIWSRHGRRGGHDDVAEIDADAALFGTPPLRSATSRCSSTAQRTASTTLANSTSSPSPLVLVPGSKPGDAAAVRDDLGVRHFAP
jgi:hypothetical protein